MPGQRLETPRSIQKHVTNLDLAGSMPAWPLGPGFLVYGVGGYQRHPIHPLSIWGLQGPPGVPEAPPWGFLGVEKPIRPSKTYKNDCFSKSAETRVPAGLPNLVPFYRVKCL